MKTRRKRKTAKPPPAPRGGHVASIRPVSLQYKVVELSTVDEFSIEQTVNHWVSQGWRLENLQFAMRESSKRPAMAFVFFTREATQGVSDEEAAREKLVRLAEQNTEPQHVRRISALQRLAELADDREPSE